MKTLRGGEKGKHIIIKGIIAHDSRGAFATDGKHLGYKTVGIKDLSVFEVRSKAFEKIRYIKLTPSIFLFFSFFCVMGSLLFPPSLKNNQTPLRPL